MPWPPSEALRRLPKYPLYPTAHLAPVLVPVPAGRSYTRVRGFLQNPRIEVGCVVYAGEDWRQPTRSSVSFCLLDFLIDIILSDCGLKFADADSVDDVLLPLGNHKAPKHERGTKMLPYCFYACHPRNHLPKFGGKQEVQRRDPDLNDHGSLRSKAGASWHRSL